MSEQENWDNKSKNAIHESETDCLTREIGDISNYLETLKARLRELTGPTDYEKRAGMLRRSLQTSIDDGFITQEQADKWWFRWVADNSERLI